MYGIVNVTRDKGFTSGLEELFIAKNIFQSLSNTLRLTLNLIERDC